MGIAGERAYEKMLAVHGVHDTAVGIHAHKVVMPPDKGIKNLHLRSSLYMWVSIMPQ